MSSPPEHHRLPNHCGIVVLCGGGSTRMGREKNELLIDDNTTFLQRILQQATQHTDHIIIAAGQGRGDALKRRYRASTEFKNVTWVEDAVADQGPMEGIHQALKKLQQQHIALAFVTGCDVPELNFELIHCLIDNIGDHDAITPVKGKRVYGMTALYRTGVWTAAGDNVAAQRLRVSTLADSIKAKTIELHALEKYDPMLIAFENINTPEDYFDFLDKLKINCTLKMKQQFNTR